MRTPVDEVFWCKAVSAAGLTSPNAVFATTRLAPLSDRNVVYTSDRKALGWPGARHDLEVVTDGMLALARTGGVNAPSGEHCFKVDLGKTFRARTWASTAVVSIPDEPPAWADAAFAWDAPQAGAPWLPVGDAAGAVLETLIAVETPPANDLVEGFGLDGATAGLRGTGASLAAGVGFADARYAQGLHVRDTTRVAWPVTVPAAFSATFDLRFDELLAEPQVYAVWAGAAGSLSLGYDPAAGLYYLEDHLGGRIALALVRIARRRRDLRHLADGGYARALRRVPRHRRGRRGERPARARRFLREPSPLSLNGDGMNEG